MRILIKELIKLLSYIVEIPLLKFLEGSLILELLEAIKIKN